MFEETIALEERFDARPDDVFMALTDADLIRRWSGQEAVFVRKVGGEFAMFDHWVTGQVLDFKPPRLVSYSWLVKDWQDDTIESHVTIGLTREGGQTLVTLIHRGFPNETERESHKTGWIENVFNPVRKFLGASKTRGFVKKKIVRGKPAKNSMKNAGAKKPVKKASARKAVKKRSKKP